MIFSEGLNPNDTKASANCALLIMPSLFSSWAAKIPLNICNSTSSNSAAGLVPVGVILVSSCCFDFTPAIVRSMVGSLKKALVARRLAPLPFVVRFGVGFFFGGVVVGGAGDGGVKEEGAGEKGGEEELLDAADIMLRMLIPDEAG